MYLEFSENNFHKNDQTLAIEKVVSFGLRTISPFHLLQKKEKKRDPMKKQKAFGKFQNTLVFMLRPYKYYYRQKIIRLLKGYIP